MKHFVWHEKQKANKLAMLLLPAFLCASILGGCAGPNAADTDDIKVRVEYENVAAQENGNEVENADEAEAKLTEGEMADSKSVTIEDTDQMTAENENKEAIPYQDVRYKPFYGIWASSSKDINDVREAVGVLPFDTFWTEIIVTSDWSNLNPETYYALTLGPYDTEEEANANLAEAQQYFPDAYVKYSGEFLANSFHRLMLYVYSSDTMQVQDSYITLNGNSNFYEGEQTFIVDEKTVFANDCEMSVFGHYQEGMSVLEWMKVAYAARQADETDFSVIGVYEMDMTGNHVDSIHGLYWWD